MSLVKIAKSLGVSVTTVSRALGGYSDVAAGTRARVEAEAERIGYSPNTTARRLRSGRTEAIGLVLPTGAGQFDDPFFLRLMAEIGPRLTAIGLDLLVTAAPAGAAELRAYQHMVASRRVDGMLIARTRVHDERIAYLLASGIPFVTHGRTQAAGAYPWVDTDGAAACALATERLIELGHRVIGLVNAAPSYSFAHDREAGWRHALDEAGLAPGPTEAAEPTEANGYLLARRLLGAATPPTALVCATDRLAVGALHGIAANGLRVPHDVSVIGFDDLPMATYSNPPLTTIEQPIDAAAAAMVAFLQRRIAGEGAANLHAILPTRLIRRASDGPPNAAVTQLDLKTIPGDLHDIKDHPRR